MAELGSDVWAAPTLLGNHPKQDSLLVSCDQSYLDLYLSSLAYSVAANTTKSLHVHVVNPKSDKGFFQFSSRFAELTDHRRALTFSYNHVEATNVDKFKTYCTCVRFLVANHFRLGNCMILDVDSLFERDVPWPIAPAGVFLTLTSKAGKARPINRQVNAGLVYISSKGSTFIEKVVDCIVRGNTEWYADQLALYHAYSELQEELSFFVFDKSTIDWDVSHGPAIWSGKGSAKTENESYVLKAADYTRRFRSS